MFVFDTSGSMGGVLQEAKEEIETLTLTLAGIQPLTFSVTLEDQLGAKYKLNQIALEALAGVATVVAVLAVVPEEALTVAAALAVEGISVAVSAKSRGYRSL